MKKHRYVWIGKKVKIGDNVRIQPFAFIPDGVTIEDDVFIGPHVCFTNDPNLTCLGPKFWKETVVKRGAKIGANSTILAGVTIGKDSIVGMGSVVLSDIPDKEVWAGNPARFLKTKDQNDLLKVLVEVPRGVRELEDIEDAVRKKKGKVRKVEIVIYDHYKWHKE
jgi:UDP-2-acetamido-3-amino-2,3-dideoxy-glucuronate N-acetyltransferase